MKMRQTSLIVVAMTLLSACGEKAPDCGDPAILDQVKQKITHYGKAAMTSQAVAIGKSDSMWARLMDATGQATAKLMGISVIEVLALGKEQKLPFSFDYDSNSIEATITNARIEEQKKDIAKNICAVNYKLQGAVYIKLNLGKLVGLATNETSQQNATAMANLEKLEGISSNPIQPTQGENQTLKTYWEDVTLIATPTNLSGPRKIEINQGKKIITETIEVAGIEDVAKYSVQKTTDGNVVVELLPLTKQ